MGVADDYDRLASDIHALSTLVNALSDHMRILRVALTKGETEAREQADKARVGVVADGTAWCPKSRLPDGARSVQALRWCAFAAGHDGPHSFDLPL